MKKTFIIATVVLAALAVIIVCVAMLYSGDVQTIDQKSYCEHNGWTYSPADNSCHIKP